MKDLIVIGGGYWGVACALRAERAGATVTMIDDAGFDGASKAASGHFALSWFAKEKRKQAEAALAIGSELLSIERVGALEHAAWHKESRRIDDWYTFSPEEFLELRKPDVRAAAKKIEIVDGGVEVCGHVARRVVVAAGIGTDEILLRSGLEPMGLKGLRGTGVFVRAERADPVVELVKTNPYRHFSIRRWKDGCVRLGDTLETKPNATQVNEMIRRTAPYVSGPVDRVVSGIRPMRDEGPGMKRVHERVIAASGGGRIGGIFSLAIADQIAKEFLE